MSRVKTFDSTGLATSGRLYAGDLNAMEDQYADLSNLTQNVQVGTLAVGEVGLQLLRYGAGEARISGALRTDGIVRALGGLYAGAFTTAARDAIPLGSRPYGLVILNTTTNRYEYNAGTDAAPNWQQLFGQINTADIANGAITPGKVAASAGVGDVLTTTGVGTVGWQAPSTGPSPIAMALVLG